MSESSLPELVDRAVVAELRASIGAKGADELLRSFSTEAAERLAALRALTVDRADTIRFYLHSLHGAAGMFGLERLSALLKKLHRDCDSLTPDAYRLAIGEIAGLLAASLAALAALGLHSSLD